MYSVWCSAPDRVRISRREETVKEYCSIMGEWDIVFIGGTILTALVLVFLVCAYFYNQKR